MASFVRAMRSRARWRWAGVSLGSSTETYGASAEPPWSPWAWSMAVVAVVVGVVTGGRRTHATVDVASAAATRPAPSIRLAVLVVAAPTGVAAALTRVPTVMFVPPRTWPTDSGPPYDAPAGPDN